MFKKYVQWRLERYVQKYFKKHPEVKLVVVAGSVGKTSTKIAIARILSTVYRVGLHEGNHNSSISAPLAILGVAYPHNIRSWFAWMAVFRAARQRVRRPATVDVIIQELGTDRPGDIACFARYLRPDIAVITSVTAEHMAQFGTLEAVAQEELSTASFSQMAIINRDDIDGRFAEYLTNPNIVTYGTSQAAEYKFEIAGFRLGEGYTGHLRTPVAAQDDLSITIGVVGEHNIRPAVGAATVALHLGMTPQQVEAAMSQVHPIAGRMNLLRGLRDSKLIDDTYNSSPLAASAALETLYTIEAPQKIAVLGSMNELGAMSANAHRDLGLLCDPDQLAWVVTVGDEAERYLAPAAKSRGCQVKSCRTALEAGAFVNKVMEPRAVVLFKGSEGDIYLEEAVKILLHSTEDIFRLVRQSPSWMARKHDFFSKF